MPTQSRGRCGPSASAKSPRPSPASANPGQTECIIRAAVFVINEMAKLFRKLLRERLAESLRSGQDAHVATISAYVTCVPSICLGSAAARFGQRLLRAYDVIRAATPIVAPSHDVLRTETLMRLIYPGQSRLTESLDSDRRWQERCLFGAVHLHWSGPRKAARERSC